MRRRDILTLPLGLLGQEPDVDFVCPMDADVHLKGPGKCPRCGMSLVAGLPPPLEYPVAVSMAPRRVTPGQAVSIRFRIVDPRTNQPNPKLQLIHERLFHLFVIGPNLEFFAHEHPEIEPDGSFRLQMTFPTPGAYRLLCDFFPEKGTPQMVARTVIVPGARPVERRLEGDLLPKPVNGVTFSLGSEPVAPIAAQRTRLVFDLNPATGWEPFLGAWGHLLIASQDRQDLIHTHPFLAYSERGYLQLNVIFPRPGVHRLWLQVQRSGEVLTSRFDVAVKRLS